MTRLALIGNALPRRCGIATFTTDLRAALAAAQGGGDPAIVAMSDHGQHYDYPAHVACQIHDDRPADYLRAAAFLNAGRYDAVSLQHEFGIFGGEAGADVLTLIEALTMPVITTLHTVLARPNPGQAEVMGRIVAASARVVVMAGMARDLMRTVYGAPADKIEVIPHGIPDMPFVEPTAAKARLGFAARSVILTFGLLSPNKGIEVMIAAMPEILRHRPDAIYVVLGATHPNLVRQHGEAYRQSLVAQAEGLGVAGSVVFLDQFVDQPTLLDYISACDVYVTPYQTEAQMTSGTLATSFGLGKAVVSTPYWHAAELLGQGRGVLVPFGEAAPIAAEIASLLTDPVRRLDLRRRAYAVGRGMTWARTAERYLACIAQTLPTPLPRPMARPMPLPQVQARGPLPRARPTLRPVGAAAMIAAPGTAHFLAMCDDTGLYQHAVHSVPDRSHGYCVDDNARALLVACALNDPGETALPEPLAARFAAFVQHAWNPDTGRFRNFMAFDRRWLEPAGSEDSHARTLWALGICARDDATAARRAWAAGLFHRALPTAMTFGSPRAWAFTLLGLDGIAAGPGAGAVAGLRQTLADRLMAALAAVATPDWVWFEDELSYDNPRLPQALIVTGLGLGRPAYVAAGLRALRWLTDVQTAPSGVFRPVGSDSFGRSRRAPQPFDQQPLEAAAAIAACRAADLACGDPAWALAADCAFSWFTGANDLSTPLVDPESGSCRDGLHPDRPNENRGGESVVSYLLGAADLRGLARHRAARASPVALRALHA